MENFFCLSRFQSCCLMPREIMMKFVIVAYFMVSGYI